MEKRVSITAKMSAFVRDFHSDKLLSRGELYNDPLAGKMLNGEIMKIWESIAANADWLCEGRGEGCEDPVLYGINRRLAPAVLAQAIWWEQELRRELKMGTRQILLLGAGLDSLPYRQTGEMEKAKYYEVDMPEMIAYKELQLKKGKITMPENVYRVGADLAENWIEPLLWQTPFAPEERSLTVMLGVAYYLPQKALDKLLAQLANITPRGSTLLFDCQLAGFGVGVGHLAEQLGHVGDGAVGQIVLVEPTHLRVPVLFQRQHPPEVGGEWLLRPVQEEGTAVGTDLLQRRLGVQSGRLRRGALGQAQCLGAGGVLLVHVGHDVVKDVSLPLVVLVQGGRFDAHSGGDLLHAHRLVALLGEEGQRFG